MTFKIFAKKEKKTSKAGDTISLPSANSRLGSLISRDYSHTSSTTLTAENFRIFVATWNAGGNIPHDGIDLNDFLPAGDHLDLYVLGFQEIVPLNAGNVLVIEDNEPAVKWLSLINQALNGPSEADMDRNSCKLSSYNDALSSETSIAKTSASRELKMTGGPLFFQKPSLNTVSKSFRNDQGWKLKACNCSSDGAREYYSESCFKCHYAHISVDESSDKEEEKLSRYSFVTTDEGKNQQKYSLIACKQMVGIFVTIWARRELVQHIGHLRVSCVGRGILGYLGNKGCISVSMSLHQTSFCFVCSHLASGEKEGDELRRNSDVIEMLKNTQFRRICKGPNQKVFYKILEHDRVIWLGDLNYRIALSYSETKELLEENNWDALFKNDQLKIEREAGRVFKGWDEGKIYFAPTYKYSYNSDSYDGETVASKKKRRTPAWCDRILWHGAGITQLSYFRGESKFSDHRPVCATFNVAVG